MGYVRVQLRVPYSDCERITPAAFMEGLGSLWVTLRLEGTDSLDAYYQRIKDAFLGYLRLRAAGRCVASDVVCCAITLPSKAISVNHRRFMRILSGCFGLSYVEVRSADSRNGRYFDLRGDRVSVLSFLPVYSYVIFGYDLLLRRLLRRMGGSRQDKFRRRAEVSVAIEDMIIALRAEMGL